MDTKLVDPSCQIKGGDFRVSSGKTYLKTGIEGSGDPSNRIHAVKEGVRVTTEAINGGQSQSSAAWYWLGRLYLQQGDLVGADSAFNKAEQLSPGCKDDIGKYRHKAWAALVNGGNAFRQTKQDDSAIVMYRAATAIDPKMPLPYSNIAEIYNDRDQKDTALVYFQRAAATEPSDTSELQIRNQALFNSGVLLLNSGRAADAVPAFEKYTQAMPGDPSGKKALASAYRASGQTDKAQVLEKELVGMASAGAAAGGEALTDADLFDLGIKQFGDKDYKDAAATFGKVIDHQPFYRDALFNQANAYLGLQDGANLAATAERLIGIEPMNEYDHKLRQQGYQLAGNKDKVLEAATAQFALPLSVEIDKMTLAGSNVSLTGKVTGRDAQTGSGKPIPAAPVTLVFEFLDATGQVLGSQEVNIPVLKAGASQPLQVSAKVDGVRAWRYRAK
jgi:tetratricopeptide (TPR) repeat protein